MYEVGRQLYVPGLGSLISTPNIFFQNGPENMVFSTVFVHHFWGQLEIVPVVWYIEIRFSYVHHETSGTSDSTRPRLSYILIKNVEKVE